jgi:hypothetical protein
MHLVTEQRDYMVCSRGVVVDDSARRFWLRRFSHVELARMAAAMTGREPDVERIGRERRRLLP